MSTHTMKYCIGPLYACIEVAYCNVCIMLALTHLLTLVASCTGPRKYQILTNIERKPRSFCSVSVKRSCGTLSTDMHAELSSSPHAAMTKTRNRETSMKPYNVFCSKGSTLYKGRRLKHSRVFWCLA